ncbi:MAG: hypothetical protein ACK561_17535 [Pseudomonadaceae bacterium]
MSFHRFLALFVASALCATANLSLAEQISGQLQISLTILKRCEVSARSDDVAVQLTGHGCEHAAYQVRDGNERILPVVREAEAGTIPLHALENAGSTLVIYW